MRLSPPAYRPFSVFRGHDLREVFLELLGALHDVPVHDAPPHGLLPLCDWHGINLTPLVPYCP